MFKGGDSVNEGSDTSRVAFTERELEILNLLANGLSDREIADELFLSLNTIKWYNRKIFAKLEVCSRTQAVSRAHRLNLLEVKLLMKGHNLTQGDTQTDETEYT
jgi:ATP/maltotriose-dependent transcriptional regulator MalT